VKHFTNLLAAGGLGVILWVLNAPHYIIFTAAMLALLALHVALHIYPGMMWDLRFPTLEDESRDTHSSETLVDFKDMLLVTTQEDINYHRLRVFHLRRRNSAEWEMEEQFESWEKSLKEAEDVAARFKGFSTFGERLEELRAGLSWKPIASEEVGKLEVAYQLSLHRYRETEWPKTRVQLALDRETAGHV
jgi:hypothetical protein